jgi:hypothetical protein
MTKPTQNDRELRLQQALRENLRKRKVQARETKAEKIAKDES